MPVPVTYRVGRPTFRKAMADTLAAVEEKFAGKIVVPEPNRLTRQQALAALRGVGVIQD